MLLSAEMLNMLNHVGDLQAMFEKYASFCRNVEYVDHMLNVFSGTYKAMELVSPRYIQHIQHIQHFCRKKHFLYKISSKLQKCWICWINVGDLVWKMCFFLQKCWICWICWMFFEPISKGAYRFLKHSTYSTYSTFPQKEAHVFEQDLQHDSTYSTFQQKEAFSVQN